MKQYRGKNNGSYYKPYAGYNEAAYGPGRKSHFRGPLRNTNGTDMNARRQDPARQDHKPGYAKGGDWGKRQVRGGNWGGVESRGWERRSASDTPGYAKGGDWGKRQASGGNWGGVESGGWVRRSASDKPGSKMEAAEDGKVSFVLDRRGGRDRNEAKEDKVVSDVWKWVIGRKAEEKKKQSMASGGGKGGNKGCDHFYPGPYDSEDDDSCAPDSDYEDEDGGNRTNLEHFEKVTKAGLSFCLKKAAEYWNDPDSSRYQIQCPCEWVRKNVSLRDVSFVLVSIVFKV